MNKKLSDPEKEVLTVGVFKAIWEEGMQMIASAFEKVATKEDLSNVEEGLKSDIEKLDTRLGKLEKTATGHGKVLESILEITSSTDKKVNDMQRQGPHLENHEKRIEKLEIRVRR